MTVFGFFLLTLIIWRLTNLLVEEQGPYDIFQHLRDRTEKFGGINLDCFYCTSVWVAVGVCIFTQNHLVYSLALSASAIFVQHIKDSI